MAALAVADEDAAIRLINPNLVCPSWRYAGREAACTNCRDLGFTTRLRDPTDERSGTEQVSCRCRTQLQADKRVSAIVGEQLAREIRLETFKLSWPDSEHNRAASVALGAAKAWSIAWADKTIPPWLALVGPPGCGKTHLAIGALRYLTECGVDNAYYQAGELLALYKMAMDQESAREQAAVARERVAGAAVLVLDDYGMERATAYNDSELEAILTVRAQKRLMTCITSNNVRRLSDRVRSRMNDRTLCAVPDLTGAKDVRRWL